MAEATGGRGFQGVEYLQGFDRGVVNRLVGSIFEVDGGLDGADELVLPQEGRKVFVHRRAVRAESSRNLIGPREGLESGDPGLLLDDVSAADENLTSGELGKCHERFSLEGLPEWRTRTRRWERSRTSSTVAVQEVPTLVRTATGTPTRLWGREAVLPRKMAPRSHRRAGRVSSRGVDQRGWGARNSRSRASEMTRGSQAEMLTSRSSRSRASRCRSSGSTRHWMYS